LFTLLESLIARDGVALIKQAEAMEERSLSFDAALQELAALLHQIALAQTVPEAIAADLPERPQILSLAQRISPEFAQLYYQIATLGRRDLSLAPDEFAGFSMTLLRMLAFAPSEQAVVAVATPSAPPIAAAPPAPAYTSTAPVQTARPAPDPSPTLPPKAELTEKLDTIRNVLQTTTGFNGDWRSFVDSLKAGMTRSLAQNCELISHDAQSLVLSVKEAQKHMLTYQDMLKTALKERFGNIQIRIEIGAGTGNTPAAQISQEKAQRQAAAEEAIRDDPFIRDLAETFGASVTPSSIKPIQ
jgi:DNA polymerase-3 subunit gamma/tau